MDFHEVSYEHSMLLKEGSQQLCQVRGSMGSRRSGSLLNSPKKQSATWYTLYGGACVQQRRFSLELVKDLGVHGGGHDISVGDAVLAVLVLQVHFQLPQVDWGQSCPRPALPHKVEDL